MVASGCSIFDWNELSSVCRACFPAMPASEVSYHLVHNKSGIRILREGGRIAGFSINNPAHSDEFAWLEMIGVAPGFRQRGLGAEVLADYERFVAGLGYARIEFAVDRDNASAIALYEARGYRCTPRPGNRLTYVKPLAMPGARGRANVARPGALRRLAYRLLYRLLVRPDRADLHRADPYRAV